MIQLDSIRIILFRVTKRLRRANGINRKPVLQGLPKGLQHEQLDYICREQFGSPLRKTAYVHLSGWKTLGAYRLILNLQNGEHRRIVFKNVVYDDEQLPALIDFPIHPGPPEFTILSTKDKALRSFLPNVYSVTELVPQKHYQYLLEDLSTDYHYVRDPQDFIQVAQNLPRIHQILDEWVASKCPTSLLEYDLPFAKALCAYTVHHLQNYSKVFSTPELHQVLERWSDIQPLYINSPVWDAKTVKPVHGDLNFTNIHLHNKNAGAIKLVDWEWSGFGQPYADLASLLKGAPTKVVEPVLQICKDLNPQLSERQHRYLYQWCVLERGLLDAGFLAAQINKSLKEANFSLPTAIKNSLSRILTAAETLTTLQE